MVRAFATQTTTSPSLEPIMTRRIFSVDVNNNISKSCRYNVGKKRSEV